MLDTHGLSVHHPAPAWASMAQSPLHHLGSSPLPSLALQQVQGISDAVLHATDPCFDLTTRALPLLFSLRVLGQISGRLLPPCTPPRPAGPLNAVTRMRSDCPNCGSSTPAFRPCLA